MNDKRFWFRAKRYGWGWGLPLTWEGWLVLVGYVAMVVAGRYIFPPAGQRSGFIAYVVVLTVVLCAICYAKGEPAKWRWGKR